MILFAAPLFAADVRFMWLPNQTNVPGVPMIETPTTRYGVQVFMDSDDAKVNEFAVTLTVRIAGEIRVVTGNVARSGKAEGVTYSTIFSAWFDEIPEVLAISVKGQVTREVTGPVAGKRYEAAQ
jgi:hypothetical protein